MKTITLSAKQRQAIQQRRRQAVTIDTYGLARSHGKRAEGKTGQ